MRGGLFIDRMNDCSLFYVQPFGKEQEELYKALVNDGRAVLEAARKWANVSLTYTAAAAAAAAATKTFIRGYLLLALLL